MVWECKDGDGWEAATNGVALPVKAEQLFQPRLHSRGYEGEMKRKLVALPQMATVLNIMTDRHNLPRREPEHYQGFAAVFWSHSLENRATGWLDEIFNRDFRELLAHAAMKYQVVCPAYCLMPDHFHLVWMGLELSSDQLNATQFLRKQINRMLAGEELVDRTNLPKQFRSAAYEGGAVAAASAGFNATPATASQPWLRGRPQRSFRLQHQAHDHVLNEEERKRNAFAKTCFYILENPQRANLVEHTWEWPFSGALFAGYPSLWPFDGDYWPLFWKLYMAARKSPQL